MKGTLDWLANGTIATDTGVSSPPKNAATFWPCTSSRAAITPLAGLLSSSRTRSSTFFPSKPPLALTSSIASDNPRTMASPDFADCPDIAATRPSLIVSSAFAGSATANESDAAPTASRNLRDNSCNAKAMTGVLLYSDKFTKFKQALCHTICTTTGFLLQSEPRQQHFLLPNLLLNQTVPTIPSTR